MAGVGLHRNHDALDVGVGRRAEGLGHTGRFVVRCIGGRENRRLRLHDEDPVLGRWLEGEHAGSILEHRDRATGDLSRETGVLGATDDLEARCLEAGHPATQGHHPRIGLGEAIRIDEPTREGQLETDRRAFLLFGICREEEQVHTGVDGGDDVDDLECPLPKRPHVEGVGDHDTLEAHRVAQQTGIRLDGERAWEVVRPGQRREGEVARHGHLHVGGDRCTERRELVRL